MIELLIVAPSNSLTHHVPAGFIFVDEVFDEANLSDAISHQQRTSTDLERALGYLRRRYPKRIAVRRLNLWSPEGLWATIRYRLRSFPAVIIDHSQVLVEDQLEFRNLRDLVEALLSQPITTSQ